MNTINFWPILVASIAAFAIQAFWYSPIVFGRRWQKLSTISDVDIADHVNRGVWKLYIGQFILTVVMFIVVGFFISGMQSNSVTDGIFIGLLVWLGFILTKALQEMLWQKKSFRLFLIAESSSLICLLVGGAIIAAWK